MRRHRKGVHSMNVQLSQELEQLVQSKVQSGRYSSASEVIREALHLMDERDQVMALRREEIRERIAQGLASLERGKGVEGESVFARIEAELAALERDARRSE